MEGFLDQLSAVVSAAVIGFASLLVFTACFTSFRAGRHTGTLFATQLGVGLEFLLAAGLIRLAAVDSFAALGVAASIIAVRRAISLGLRNAARGTG